MPQQTRLSTSPLAPTAGLVRWFRIAAIAEACSWAGLLVGMLFKYVIAANDIGVKIFGPIHGVLFLIYVVTVVLVARAQSWTPFRWTLGLLASIPPFFTIWFERASRRFI